MMRFAWNRGQLISFKIIFFGCPRRRVIGGLFGYSHFSSDRSVIAQCETVFVSFNFFALGIFSIFSLVLYLDIGAYINALLFFILLYFFARFEFKKCLSILLGILVGWLLFIYTYVYVFIQQ